MKTEDSIEWFRAKNRRRKQQRIILGAKTYNTERKHRKSLLNGAFGKKETETKQND